jgi:voltage-gated potassium channel
MTDLLAHTSARQRRRFVFVAFVRTVLTVALVVLIYYVVPLDHGTGTATVLELTLAVLGLFVIVAVQVRQIIRSDHPNARAVEALAFSVPLYVVVFAVAYFLMAHTVPTAFDGAMTRTDSLYFSTTVFTTVGFGDITAKSQPARVLVTLQMWLDLVILGLVARVVVNAVKLGQQRQSQRSTTGSGDAP